MNTKKHKKCLRKKDFFKQLLIGFIQVWFLYFALLSGFSFLVIELNWLILPPLTLILPEKNLYVKKEKPEVSLEFYLLI